MALFINGVGQDTFNMNGVSIDNLYVDGVLVWTSIPEVAGIPRYELTEALVDTSTVDDSANTLDTYNGLLTESDGTTPYLPTELQYPGNGLLELDNGRLMDTQFTIDANADSYGLYGIYDADGSTTYKIWALHMSNANIGTLYEGDQDTPLTETGGIFVGDLTGVYKVTDGRPSWLPPLVNDTEYVTNGTFDTNVDNWDGVYSPTITWDNGRAKMTQAGTYRAMRQLITGLTDGVVYTLSIDAEEGDITQTQATPMRVAIRNEAEEYIEQLDLVTGTGQTYDFSTSPGETAVYIDPGIWEGAAGNYCWFDNISIKEKV